MSDTARLEKWLDIQNKFEAAANEDEQIAAVFAAQIERTKLCLTDILQYILFFEEADK